MENILDWPTLLVFIVSFLVVWMYWSSRLPNGFPNGPRPLPIIGNMLVMLGDSKEVQKTLNNLSQKYGPIIGLKLGSVPTVLLNDLDSIKEVLVKHDDSFSARPHFLKVLTETTRKPPGGPVRGVIWTNGEVWKQSRRFSLSAMRDFGVGKKSIEYKIQEEVIALCNEFASNHSKPCKPMKLLQSSVSNIICNVCFGSRFEYTDPLFIELLELLNKIFQSNVFKSAGNFFPFASFIARKGHVIRNLAYLIDRVDEWIVQQIEKHRDAYDPNEIKDFVDLYLSNENEGDSSYSPYNVRRIIANLFSAGTETTSTALRWFLLYMIHNPDIQKKLQQEIDALVGQSRLAKLEDRKNMPYMEAVLHETLRLCNIVPMAVPHSSSEDVTVRGFKIPKDTLVFPNTAAVHMDSHYWEKPEEFFPERWIGDDGNFQKQEAFVPFSIGPRVCLGESLAWNEMFLFATTIIQRFNLSMCDPSNPPPLHGKVGITHAPVDFEMIFDPR